MTNNTTQEMSDDDRVLIRIAAQAINRKVVWRTKNHPGFLDDNDTFVDWNPLVDDGVIAQLEADMGIDVRWYPYGVEASKDGVCSTYIPFHFFGGDRRATRRRATLSVAANIKQKLLSSSHRGWFDVEDDDRFQIMDTADDEYEPC